MKFDKIDTIVGFIIFLLFMITVLCITTSITDNIVLLYNIIKEKISIKIIKKYFKDKKIKKRHLNAIKKYEKEKMTILDANLDVMISISHDVVRNDIDIFIRSFIEKFIFENELNGKYVFTDTEIAENTKKISITIIKSMSDIFVLKSRVLFTEDALYSHITDNVFRMLLSYSREKEKPI